MSSCGLLWLIKSSPAIFLAKILLRGENGGKNGGNRRNENSGKSVPWTTYVTSQIGSIGKDE
jgi:hypothetical protein